MSEDQANQIPKEMRNTSKIIKKENDIIENITGLFVKNNLRSQIKTSISPGNVSGNIALGYHRGLAWGRAQSVRDCVRVLKKQFPEASQFLKKKFERDYKYK